ncbi:hypothetical protein [Altererythrobacter lutimaris]|uniref:DUF2092 domain-containing protein n=1 Tax=Altererythrobacter lutimaris TaxID=2743979 RepID=A0A850HDD0_9SPHN|nr:hypothetical protein [Altererythrobacter lutimaris]NVE95620.1 hypothetical protein [Altererythrobacter lutimaris]
MCKWLGSLAAIMLGMAGLAQAEEPTSARDVVERGIAVHGGALFLDPGTLQLSGTATFFDGQTGQVRAIADDYTMARAFERGRTEAHGADGKVRIIAKSGERTIFAIGYDGETTWTERGIMPKAQADEYWANNFGFGIIRSALDDGFTLSLAPQRDILGHETAMVRITDPQGAETLFGFDVESGFIRYMAFDSPRGWHERLYDEYVKLENGWVQARSVTLLYDGIKANTVFWSETKVGEAIDPEIFAPPAEMLEADRAE